MKRHGALLALAMSAACFVAATAASRDGDPDLSFGPVSGGVFRVPLTVSDSVQAVALQPDGKLVAAGTANGNRAIALVRLLPSGALDPSFGSGGKSVIDLGNGAAAWAIALQPDGRILVAGTASGDFCLARVTASGALDSGFASGGKVVTDVFGKFDGAQGLLLLPDGRILVAGSAQAANGYVLAVVRYSAAGVRDNAFGTGGVATANEGVQTLFGGLARQADGRIVVSGSSSSAGSWNFAVARWSADGAPDLSFGSAGIVTTDFAGGNDLARDVRIQADGKIVVAGAASPAGAGSHFALARYDTRGVLDPSFGSGGKVLTPSFRGAFDGALALALQSDGKIVAVGSANDPSLHSDFAVARYLPSGALDPTFGAGGQATADVGFYNDQATAVVVQTDGRVVLGGVAYDASASKGQFAFARFTSSGSLDLAFGVLSGGRVVTSISANDSLRALAVRTDGKIVAAGAANGNQDIGLARYRTDGTLDPTFGTGGTKVLDLGRAESAAALALLADGRMLVAGGASSDFLVARLSDSGALDASFGSGGKVFVDVAGQFDTAQALTVQPDGKLLVGGSAQTAAGYVMAVVRLTATGAVDAAFGTNGRVTVNPGVQSFLSDLALQPDGRIVMAGYAWNGKDYDFAVARRNADGSPDGSFGSGGAVTTDFAGAFDLARAVAVQSDGKIVVAGNAAAPSSYAQIALARYTISGALDSTFGSAGKVMTPSPAQGPAGAMAVLVQGDGRIVVAGDATGATGPDFALARYLANGTLDATFGSAGEVGIDFSGTNDQATAVARQADGKIVSAGTTWNAAVTHGSFALARLLGSAPTSASRFTPLSPCRLLDTRAAAGPLGGPALTAGSVRTFPLAGACGVAAGVRALSVNVTVTGASTAGELRLFAGGTAAPTASAISYGAGQTRANNAMVGLGTAGDLSVLCAQPAGTAHVIVDVNGVFR